MGIDKFISVTELDKKKTGQVNANQTVVKNASNPIDANDLTTKNYVDDLFEKVDKRVEFIANDEPISLISKKHKTQSIVQTSINGVIICAAPAIKGISTDGASCYVSAGNAEEEGKGGDIKLASGVSGVGGENGKIYAYGALNINGVLEFADAPDPGEPPVNLVYMWFDASTRSLKLRKKGQEDVVLI